MFASSRFLNLTMIFSPAKTMPTTTPNFVVHADAKRFFVDVKTDSDEKDGKMMINLRSACVVVTTAFGDSVAFTKTNRGQNYRDSRGKKTERKNEWGDKIVRISPLMISESEVRGELNRLLGDSQKANDAFRALQV